MKTKIPEEILTHLRKCRCPKCAAPLEAAQHIGERFVVLLTPGGLKRISREAFGCTEMHVRCSAFPQHDIEGKLGTVVEQEIIEYLQKIHQIKQRKHAKQD